MVGERGTEIRERLRLIDRMMEPKLRLRRRRTLASSPRQNFLVATSWSRTCSLVRLLSPAAVDWRWMWSAISGSWSSGTVRKAGQTASGSGWPILGLLAGRGRCRGAVDDGDRLVGDRRLRGLGMASAAAAAGASGTGAGLTWSASGARPSGRWSCWPAVPPASWLPRPAGGPAGAWRGGNVRGRPPRRCGRRPPRRTRRWGRPAPWRCCMRCLWRAGGCRPPTGA
jgi:hypothetical protein